MTPAERLARSRLAIIEHLARREPRNDSRNHHDDDAVDAAIEGTGPSRGGGWFRGLSGAAKTWWRQHPAQLGLELVTPALQSYARHKPFRVLAISAAVGAALVLTRPWRLISLTTVLLALVKSSHLTGVVMSALTASEDWQSAPQQRKH